MADPILNLEVLQSFRELQGPEDPTFVKDYFAALIDSFAKHIVELEKAITAKDHVKIATHAHGVKSTSANAGMVKINVLAAKIEKMGNEKSGAVTLEMHGELRDLCAAAKAEILALPEFK